MDVKVALLSQFPPASMRAVEANETEILLIRNSAGVVSALRDRCSHADVRLSEGTLEDSTVECVAHGAKFDIVTGKALCMPAVAPVKGFEVKIQGDEVFVVMPD